jgi:hypothetical protein
MAPAALPWMPCVCVALKLSDRYGDTREQGFLRYPINEEKHHDASTQGC